MLKYFPWTDVPSFPVSRRIISWPPLTKPLFSLTLKRCATSEDNTYSEDIPKGNLHWEDMTLVMRYHESVDYLNDITEL